MHANIYTHPCTFLLCANFHLSLLKGSEAIPADNGGRSAFLGLPRGCHHGSQALGGRSVDQLQPGLDGRPPAHEEAICTQVQRECLARTDSSETIQHLEMWKLAHLVQWAHPFAQEIHKKYELCEAAATAPGTHLDPDRQVLRKGQSCRDAKVSKGMLRVC